MNLIEITLSDGTVAKWETTDQLADEIISYIESLVGHPNTIKA